MTLFCIGGTGFIGRAIVQRLADAGHAVTVFHRGRTAPDLRDAVTIRHGDRDDPAALRNALDATGPDAVLDAISKPNPWHVISSAAQRLLGRPAPSAVEKSPRTCPPASGRFLNLARNDPLRVLRSRVYPHDHA
jgi:putative NADH-flavin reductase